MGLLFVASFSHLCCFAADASALSLVKTREKRNVRAIELCISIHK